MIARYRDWLPIRETDPVVTLGEGGTPLIPAVALSELLACEVWLKVEGANPTGSFKDRGMTVAVSISAGDGAQAVVCASTGNTSASAAAYAARAGLRPVVLLPAGKIAAGKLAQAIVHGAQVVQIQGNFDDCLRLARRLAEHYPVSLVNSVTRYGSKARKRRLSRSSTPSATRRTSMCCRWATVGTSRPTGAVTPSTRRRTSVPDGRGCGPFRSPVPLRSYWAGR